MKYLSILLFFFIASCGVNQQTLKTSLQVNQVTLAAYQDVSSALKYLVEDIIDQLSKQGKDTSGLSHYLDVIQENDKSVLKVCQALKDVLETGLLNDKSYEEFFLSFLDSIIYLYKYQENE